jgi:hypothetical protein
MPSRPPARRATTPFRTSFAVAPRELTFLRAGVGAAAPARSELVHSPEHRRAVKARARAA